jgi:hypothetical protein
MNPEIIEVIPKEANRMCHEGYVLKRLTDKHIDKELPRKYEVIGKW